MNLPYKIDPLEQMVENSFRNFHAKGFDYLCLQRSPGLTLKAYFFDELPGGIAEVVCPHDHRYPFTTTVLSGYMRHYRYLEQPPFIKVGHQIQTLSVAHPAQWRRRLYFR